MKEAMEAIEDPEVTLENKEIAFDNFELMIEQLDNANNIENLGLWPSLIALLSSPEKSLRVLSAWVCGTAVQNNLKSQESFHKHGGVPKIAEMAINDPEHDVRKKAIYAFSSATRNLQPALDAGLEKIPAPNNSAAVPGYHSRG